MVRATRELAPLLKCLAGACFWSPQLSTLSITTDWTRHLISNAKYNTLGSPAGSWTEASNANLSTQSESSSGRLSWNNYLRTLVPADLRTVPSNVYSRTLDSYQAQCLGREFAVHWGLPIPEEEFVSNTWDFTDRVPGSFCDCRVSTVRFFHFVTPTVYPKPWIFRLYSH